MSEKIATVKKATKRRSEPSKTTGGSSGRAGSRKRLPEDLHTCESREKKEATPAFGSPEWKALHGSGPRKPLGDMPEGVQGAAKQVRKFCLECVGGSANLVRHCAGFSCPLWAWRFGKDPRFLKDADLLDQAKVREMGAKC